MNRSADSLTEYYARRAAEYERIYEKPERQEELRHLKHWLARALAGQDVLEVACGTGYWTTVAATAARSITALDINDEVLALARAKPTGACRLTFQRADAYALPDLPRTFTAGLAAFWWSHVPKSRLGDLLNQFHRALTPGAVVVFMDNAFAAHSSTPISRADAEGNTYQQRRLESGHTFEVLKNFPSQADLLSAIRDAGEQVRSEFLEYYWTLNYQLKSPAQVARAIGKRQSAIGNRQ